MHNIGRQKRPDTLNRMPGLFYGGVDSVSGATVITLLLPADSVDIDPLLQHTERQNRFSTVYRVVDAEFSG